MLVRAPVAVATHAYAVSTVERAKLIAIPLIVKRLEVSGYYTARDGGGGNYKRVAAQPAHNGKFQSADGAWWELTENVVTPLMFGAYGDGAANDTAPVQSAFNYALNVVIPAGYTFVVDPITVRAKQNVSGTGTLKQRGNLPNASQGILFCDSGAANVFIDGITIRDITLYGLVEVNGFLEFYHNLSFSGVTNCLIENVRSIAAQGDNFYIGSSYIGGVERHNKNVTIRGCYIDGVVKNNRNGISVIDCDGIYIYNNFFTRLSRSNMPGPIDFEADAAAFHIIRKVRVIGNTFIDNTGNLGIISFFCAAVVPDYVDIIVADNIIDTYDGPALAAFSYATGKPATATSVCNNVLFEKNLVKNGGNGAQTFQIFDGKSFTIRDNAFSDVKNGGLIGYTEAANKYRDFTIENNTFTRVASINAGNAFQVFGGDYITFDGNLFDDCGSGNPGQANVIDFNVGTSSYVTITNNTFLSPTGKSLVAIQKEGAHTFTPATNKFIGNNTGNLANAFAAEESDVLWTSYLPVIAGTGAAGDGTYTRQNGRYRRIGNKIWVQGLVAVSSHTGTGQIQVSLPKNAAPIANNDTFPVPIKAVGAASTGGQIGVVNAAAVVNSVAGAIRCFATNNGTVDAQMTIPASTAFSIGYQFEYQAA